MSVPPIKVVQRKLHLTQYSSVQSSEPLPIQQLPTTPLVSYDLQFGNLKDYLNSVSNVVNSHGELLRNLIEELRTRVSVSDLLELLAGIGLSVPDSLGTVNILQTGDDWKDQMDFAIGKLSVLSQHILNLNQFKPQVASHINEIHQSLDAKASKDEVTQTVARATAKTQKELVVVKNTVTETKEELREDLQQVIKQVTERMNEVEAKLADVERHTYWKIRDTEDLLKLRVNEKYVSDAIAQAEKQIYAKLDKFPTLGDFEVKFSQILGQVSGIESRFTEKLGMLTNQMDEVFKALLRKSDFTHLNDLSEKLEKAVQDILQSKQLISTNRDNTHLNSATIQQILSDLSKYSLKEDLSQYQLKSTTIPDASMPLSSSDPEEIRTLKTSLIQLKTQLKDTSLAVNTQLTTHEERLILLDSAIQHTIADIEQLHSLLNRPQAPSELLCDSPNTVLVARRHLAGCLSCGRGDSNCASLFPQIIGTDGRLYKGATPRKPREYDLGIDVFNLDNHQHAHQPKERVPSQKQLKKAQGVGISGRGTLMRPTSAKK